MLFTFITPIISSSIIYTPLGSLFSIKYASPILSRTFPLNSWRNILFYSRIYFIIAIYSLVICCFSIFPSSLLILPPPLPLPLPPPPLLPPLPLLPPPTPLLPLLPPKTRTKTYNCTFITIYRRSILLFITFTIYMNIFNIHPLLLLPPLLLSNLHPTIPPMHPLLNSIIKPLM